MENGHVIVAATFRKEWDEKALLDFLKSLFPSKLGAFDDVEVVMSVHCRLMPPILAPGQAFFKRSLKTSPFTFDPCERFFLWNHRSRKQSFTAR